MTSPERITRRAHPDLAVVLPTGKRLSIRELLSGSDTAFLKARIEKFAARFRTATAERRSRRVRRRGTRPG
jgi:hypothetical protein